MTDPVRVQHERRDLGKHVIETIGHVHLDDLARAIRREMAAEVEIIRDDLRKGIDVDDALRWSHDRLTAPAPREPAQERQEALVLQTVRRHKPTCANTQPGDDPPPCDCGAAQDPPTPATDPLLPGMRAARDVVRACEAGWAERHAIAGGKEREQAATFILRRLDAEIARRESER